MKLGLGGLGLVGLVAAGALLPACGAGGTDITNLDGEGAEGYGWGDEAAGGDGIEGDGSELNRYSGPPRVLDPNAPGGWVTIERGGQPRTVRYEVIDGQAVIAMPASTSTRTACSAARTTTSTFVTRTNTTTWVTSTSRRS